MTTKNRIRELRQEQHKTLREVAEAVETSNQNISNWERGKSEPKLETWERLADFFGVDKSYLQGLTNSRLGLDLWAAVSGFSEKDLADTIDLMELFGETKGKTPNEIGLMAVRKLENSPLAPHGDASATRYVHQELNTLLHQVETKYFIDKQKLQAIKDKYGHVMFDSNLQPSDLYYSDADKQVYKFIESILTETIRIIDNGANYIKHSDSSKKELLEDSTKRIDKTIKELTK